MTCTSVKSLARLPWVAPDAKVEVVCPTAPLLNAIDASHGFAKHFAAVKAPALQGDALLGL